MCIRDRLYESDLQTIKPLLLELFVSVEKGNCASLQPVYTLLVARARENEAMVKRILGPDFRLDDRMELTIDVEKRPFPKTVAAKQELLKKIVQFQIENSLLSGIDMAEAKKQQIHRYELQTKRVVEQNPAQLITTAAEAFAGALDPHTSYLSPRNLEDLSLIHISEPTRLLSISYAVFCLKKKTPPQKYWKYASRTHSTII